MNYSHRTRPSAARSIHIGLNRLDPNAYGGWDGQLSGCVNDARDMMALARALGYETSIMTDSDATAAAVLQRIEQNAQQLVEGDILLITYSGHGGQIPDLNGDEPDSQDETWALWDRQLIDDELATRWTSFADGVRIVLISDSCHSGTIARQLRALAARRTLLERDSKVLRAFDAMDARPKSLPLDKQEANYLLIRDTYQAIQRRARGMRAVSGASLISLSGCQDNQVSYDGSSNGRFTEELLKVWNQGSFTGSYPAFYKKIVQGMPPDQTPAYSTVGARNPAFEAQRPFDPAEPQGDTTTQAPSDIDGAGDSATPHQPSANSPGGTAAEIQLPLRRGDWGPDVKVVQDRLVARGYSVSPTAFFGIATETAVREFQRFDGLSTTSVVDDSTWQALDR